MKFNQSKFFTELSKLLPPGEKLPQWISENLCVDLSNAYRRIRSEVKLNVEELHMILKRIPEATPLVLRFLPQANYNVIQFNSFTSIDGVREYLLRLHKMMNTVSLNDHQMTYVARDLPLFIFFAAPGLFAYKVSLWSNQLMREGVLDIPDRLIFLAREVYNDYLQLNTKELWYAQCAENLARQLQYALDLGKICPQRYSDLCDELDSVLYRIEQWSSSGEKDHGGVHKLYGTSYCTMNNGGLLDAMNESWLLHATVSAHHAITNDPQQVNLFKFHWKAHQESATKFSKGGQRQRHQFFERISERVREVGGKNEE
ncbi:MAG: hypothetical protein LPK80_11505 [Bacteroidota bacterium]|nr:hypothetical protein [Bacteroidota bacterium]MDX5448510.1 hypothetical protein [Bacteroidota bacterium]